MYSVLHVWLLMIFVCSVRAQLVKEDKLNATNEFTDLSSDVYFSNNNQTCKTEKPVESREETRNKTHFSRLPGNISEEVCDLYTQQLTNRVRLPFGMATDNIPESVMSKNNAPSTLHVIAGGRKANFQEFLHMALLGYQNDINSDIQWNCGGSLISNNFVLTAAHCVKGRTTAPKYVRLGITLQSDHSSLQELEVNETIVYPEYTPKAKYHDIALLRLNENVNFTTAVYPACLHTTKRISRKKAIATGWGYTEFSGPGSNHLMKVDLDYFSNENCTSKYIKEIRKSRGSLKRGIVDDLMICAGSNEEIKNTCQGDSGGPLSYGVTTAQDITKKMYHIVGVTSFGRACSLHKGIPGIYTRVSNYIKWIEDIVWPETTYSDG